MKIEITCDGTDYIDFKKLIPFQGDLKVITDENLEKLKASIIKYGFTVPAFIWRDGEAFYILDAHQRMKALQSLFSDGYEIPDIPVIHIEAENVKEAKEKLLYVTSQYGEFTQDGFTNFIFDSDIDLSTLDIRLTSDEMNFEMGDDFIDYSEFDDEIERLDGIEDATIEISVPVKYEKQVREWLADGGQKHASALGRGVLKKCGLL